MTNSCNACSKVVEHLYLTYFASLSVNMLSGMCVCSSYLKD